MSDFERENFIAFVHETGDICMQDSPNGWRIALDAKDVAAFIEWLKPAQEPSTAPTEANELAGALYAAMSSVSAKPIVCETMRRAAQYLERTAQPTGVSNG
jgi:hypothetical protein